MMQRRRDSHVHCASAVMLAVLLLAGGAGCSGGVAPVPGETDAGGGDAAGGPTGGCTPADCAGLAAPALAKLCPDGTSVSADLCVRETNGQCNWGFPSCPIDAGQTCPGLGCAPQCPNGVLQDQNGCDTCECAPAADAGGTGVCTSNADCLTGEICGFLESLGCSATGQCFPAPGGARCAIASPLGCGCNGTDVSIDPGCVSGLPSGYQLHPVLHEGVCAADAGGACVSDRGGPCGGNTSNPCTCATGLACTPGDSGLPFGDVGGACE
jgi:hypothetical protein